MQQRPLPIQLPLHIPQDMTTAPKGSGGSIPFLRAFPRHAPSAAHQTECSPGRRPLTSTPEGYPFSRCAKGNLLGEGETHADYFCLTSSFFFGWE
ncbi:hypothetical protein CEXT_260631 [Caerostris extrusa]|uniref:Uncharacterized protein n=1 Tax=Caerostris extrusa TaxID=172846 RepID=A0AAV4XUJ3_CAEEX|nr:hypothetical protein CEXT_260631 [Caerostris extrusa]